MRIYFDNAATTPLSPEVLDAMLPYLKEHYGNPSSIHALGRQARTAVEAARKTVANYLNASIGEVFFTSCGTESNNMALKGAVRDLGIQRIITSPLEHHCVFHTVATLKKWHQTSIEHVRVNTKGQVDLAHLEQLLKASTVPTLVALMYANNEIGTLLDWARVSALCQEHGALFHSDTVQTIGYLPIDVQQNKVAFLTGSAHKFYGPKGVGFIYINSDYQIKPYLDGGSQERNMRGGTENTAGIVGLATALELAATQMDERRQHIETLRQYFIEQLKANFNDIQFNGDYDGDYLYKILSVSFPPSSKADLIVFSLDIVGISGFWRKCL